MKEERGFTERSLNILLKKIIEHESKEEAIASGLIPEEVLKEVEPEKIPDVVAYPVKPVAPLVKNMYIRDPTRGAIFVCEKFNFKELENNPDMEDEVIRAFGDLCYDEFL